MRDYAAAAAGAARAAAAAGRWLIGRALEFLSQEWNRADIKKPEKTGLEAKPETNGKNRPRKRIFRWGAKKNSEHLRKKKIRPKIFRFFGGFGGIAREGKWRSEGEAGGERK